jgi:hypothetical protein
MQASQQMQRGVNPPAVLAAIAAALLLSGAASYLVRGALPQTQAPAAVDSVPAWAQQGTGLTDADGFALELGRAADGERLAAKARPSQSYDHSESDPGILVYG